MCIRDSRITVRTQIITLQLVHELTQVQVLHQLGDLTILVHHQVLVDQALPHPGEVQDEIIIFFLTIICSLRSERG